ncbi:metal-sulfur cluster assembly factor [Patescibacteria group bacterium]|nr:metal-sulfur cluster assembly factor [Patescibacteria group bacterium]MBU1721812.1 metal-sulfur cluster assembly factor [Patescibacteria group bacterium]MBU1901694.1 metal-sulfur cluster assembly factor [Patescibacteria group bacterium]
MLKKEQVIKALETVIDPHIGVDVWALGFIYEIEIKSDKEVYILMTLTTPACPLKGTLEEDIRNAIYLLGVETVTIETTFDPPWELPESIRKQMGF